MTSSCGHRALDSNLLHALVRCATLLPRSGSDSLVCKRAIESFVFCLFPITHSRLDFVMTAKFEHALIEIPIYTSTSLQVFPPQCIGQTSSGLLHQPLHQTLETCPVEWLEKAAIPGVDQFDGNIKRKKIQSANENLSSASALGKRVRIPKDLTPILLLEMTVLST